MAEIGKVVVTGAAGHLGSHLVPKLVADGFDVTGVDRVEPSTATGYRFVRADLADRPALEAALTGAHLIVHCAAIHPWKAYPDEQYFDANIKGTWQLYKAAVAQGIDRIVLTSSIAAVGYANITPAHWPLDETFQTITTDLYCLTKQTQEAIARQFAHLGLVRTLALRPPAFMPKPPLETGFNLLSNFALVEDIANAHLAAVRVLAERQPAPASLQAFEAFFTGNALPYTRADDVLLEANGQVGLRLVRKYWPDAADWLQERGFTSRGLPAVYDLSKSKQLLNWAPSCNFEQWFACYAQEL